MNQTPPSPAPQRRDLFQETLGMSTPPPLHSEARRARAQARLHPRSTGLRVALALALAGPALHAQTAGSLDLAFDPDVAGSYISAMAVQPDGKIALAGNFSGVGGQSRKGIARILSTGTVESNATFNPGTGVNFWNTVTAVQSDGKILIGGPFTTVNGQSRNHIARLLPNGTVEGTATFNPGTGANGYFQNDLVNSIALQADGKILIAGQFTTVNGQSRKGIARLLTNGTVEGTATFNPGTGAGSGVTGRDAIVRCVALQADGKILIGGDFTNVNGQPRNRIARLLANGTVESTATFNPGAGVDGGAGVSSEVYSIAVQADGKIVIAGNFATVNGQPRPGIARLLTDGTVESSDTFHPGANLNGFRSLMLQADGKIIVAGGGAPGGGGVVRLHVDGTVESTATFNPNFGAEDYLIFSAALQADGKILLGGAFTQAGGQPRNHIARLANDAATQTLAMPDATRVQWFRSGAAPEVEQVTFEMSANGGVSWTLLGPGTRISGGWELKGLALSGTGSLRARGRTGGGQSNSSGLVESVTAFPVLPVLSITQANAVVTVSWPFPSTGFVLQQNTGLNTGTWTPAFETVTDNPTTRSITVTPAPGSRFFRLFRP